MDIYSIGIRMDGVVRFLLWAGNKSIGEDEFLSRDQRLISFTSVGEAVHWASQQGFPVPMAGREFDLDGVARKVQEGSLCGESARDVLALWNLLEDLGQDVHEGSEFLTMSKKLDAIHRHLSEAFLTQTPRAKGSLGSGRQRVRLTAISTS